MNRLRLHILILASFVLSSFGFAFEPESILIKANEEYKVKNFSEAISLYQIIVDSGYHSAELYYNIGNSFFKQGDIPRAILNYERALLLNPTNEDIKFNLAKSQTFVVDKIEIIPEFFVKTWFRNTVVILSSDTWALFALVLFVISIMGYLLFFLGQKAGVKKLLFTLSVLITLLFMLSGFFAFKSKGYIENSSGAIVMSPTVTVKSSPDTDGLDVFIIHEGSKVVILRKLADWYEIKIADGKQGWLKSNDVEKI